MVQHRATAHQDRPSGSWNLPMLRGPFRDFRAHPYVSRSENAGNEIQQDDSLAIHHSDNKLGGAHAWLTLHQCLLFGIHNNLDPSYTVSEYFSDVQSFGSQKQHHSSTIYQPYLQCIQQQKRRLPARIEIGGTTKNDDGIKKIKVEFYVLRTVNRAACIILVNIRTVRQASEGVEKVYSSLD